MMDSVKFFFRQAYRVFVATVSILAYVCLAKFLYDYAGAVFGLGLAAYLLLHESVAADGQQTGKNGFLVEDSKKIFQDFHNFVCELPPLAVLAVVVFFASALFCDIDQDGISTFDEIIPVSLHQSDSLLAPFNLNTISNPLSFDTNRDLIPDGIAKKSMALNINGIYSYGLLAPGDWPPLCTLLDYRDGVACSEFLNRVKSDCSHVENLGLIVNRKKGEIIICEDLVGEKLREVDRFNKNIKGLSSLVQHY